MTCAMRKVSRPGQALENLRLLLSYRANPTARNRYGNTPLHTLAGLGDAQGIELFLRFGADANAVNADGWTPLDCCLHFEFTQPARASGRSQMQCAAVLLGWGAFPMRYGHSDTQKAVPCYTIPVAQPLGQMETTPKIVPVPVPTIVPVPVPSAPMLEGKAAGEVRTTPLPTAPSVQQVDNPPVSLSVIEASPLFEGAVLVDEKKIPVASGVAVGIPVPSAPSAAGSEELEAALAAFANAVTTAEIVASLRRIEAAASASAGDMPVSRDRIIATGTAKFRSSPKAWSHECAKAYHAVLSALTKP